MEDAFNFFATSKDDLTLTKFDFNDHFNESDSGFLSSFTSPDRSAICEKDNLSSTKVVTFREPPEKILKKNHEEAKSNVQLYSDKNKSGLEFNEHMKSPHKSDPKPIDGDVSTDVQALLDDGESIENYFKNLFKEISDEVCQKPLKQLLEMEQFEKASLHVLDDLLKDAKKLEAKLLKEKVALKKRVERLINAFNS